MTRDAARAEIRKHLAEYVEQITEKSKGGMYVCPLCQSGTGKNKTGAFSIDRKDPEKWHCFSCGAGGDILDLIGEMEQIKDYNGRFERACKMFGITAEGNFTPNTPEKEFASAPIEQKNTIKEATADYSEYYYKAYAHAAETDYFEKRGIADMVRFCALGYDPMHEHPIYPNVPKKPRIIIPVTKSYYIARETDPNATTRYYNVGTVELFEIEGAASRPILLDKLPPVTGVIGDEARETAKRMQQRLYVVEGAIDAMSIAEVGGRAVAMHSTSNWRKVVQLFQPNSKHRAEADNGLVVILALDNDTAGQETTASLQSELEAIKVKCVRYNPSGSFKDPNEALVADRESFKKAVEFGALAPIEQLQSVEELIAYQKTAAAYHIQGLLNDIERSRNTPPIPTGFSRLDEVFDGGFREGLYIIGAISSLGKTTLVMQIADQIAQGGHDVLIFSLEMSRKQLMAKSISRNTIEQVLQSGGDTRNAKTEIGISGGWRYGGYSQAERDLIVSAINAYSKYADKIYIHEGVGAIGAAQVRETVERHLKLTGRSPVVVVDYLQTLAPEDIRASDKQNTDRDVLALKRLSRDYSLTVLAISSFNRENYRLPVNMASFKESGAIEYGSDVLIGLQLKGAGEKEFDPDKEKQKSPRSISLKILKNRSGATGDTIDYEYYPQFNFFKEKES